MKNLAVQSKNVKRKIKWKEKVWQKKRCSNCSLERIVIKRQCQNGPTWAIEKLDWTATQWYRVFFTHESQFLEIKFSEAWRRVERQKIQVV